MTIKEENDFSNVKVSSNVNIDLEDKSWWGRALPGTMVAVLV